MRIPTATTALAVTALLASAVVGVAADTVSASTASAGTGGGCTPTATLSSAPTTPARFPMLTSIDVLSSRDIQVGGGDGRVNLMTWRGDGRTFGDPSLFPQGDDFVTENPGARASSFDSDTDGWYLTTDRYGDSAEHWHGGRWTMTPLPVSPTPATEGLVVTHIEAVSDSDAWAVGYYTAAGPGYVRGLDRAGALIEHWDGTAWSIVPDPTGHHDGDSLSTARAVSADDVWAVGWTLDGDAARPIVEHWDGTAWHVVPVSSDALRAGLFDVSGSGPGDAWAVGDKAGADGVAVAMVEHWDGTAWTEVTGLPDLGNARLDSVYAASSTNVWATVETPTGAGTFLHWDGHTWSTVAAPGPAALGLFYFYSALDGDGSRDVWAVGQVTDIAAGRSTLQLADLRC